jgi:hypothetical protein
MWSFFVVSAAFLWPIMAIAMPFIKSFRLAAATLTFERET